MEQRILPDERRATTAIAIGAVSIALYAAMIAHGGPVTAAAPIVWLLAAVAATVVVRAWRAGEPRTWRLWLATAMGLVVVALILRDVASFAISLQHLD